MGDDPRTNVVNWFNRAHGVENLYVVDSSFFPSSGGVNPALTIAANALRVAQHIIKTQGDAPQEGKENRDFPSALGRPVADLPAPGETEPLMLGRGEGSGQLHPRTGGGLS